MTSRSLVRRSDESDEDDADAGAARGHGRRRRRRAMPSSGSARAAARRSSVGALEAARAARSADGLHRLRPRVRARRRSPTTRSCVPVGAEVMAGSTRLKAGTAQKLVLNMVSTISMIRLGKTYGNLMVGVDAARTRSSGRGSARSSRRRPARLQVEQAADAAGRCDGSDRRSSCDRRGRSLGRGAESCGARWNTEARRPRSARRRADRARRRRGRRRPDRRLRPAVGERPRDRLARLRRPAGERLRRRRLPRHRRGRVRARRRRPARDGRHGVPADADHGARGAARRRARRDPRRRTRPADPRRARRRPVPLAPAARDASSLRAPRPGPGPARASARGRARPAVSRWRPSSRGARPRRHARRARRSPSRPATPTRAPRKRTRRSTAASRTVTHLFNAMRPFTHRDPGVAGAALARRGRRRPDHPRRRPPRPRHGAHGLAGGRRPPRARHRRGRRRRGQRDGSYRLGDVSVEVRDGVVRRDATASSPAAC